MHKAEANTSPPDAKRQPAGNRTEKTRYSDGVSPARAWSAVLVLLILGTFAFFDRQAISLLVDPIKATFGVSDAQMGFLQGSAFAIFFLLGTLPMGWVVDRFPAHWTIYLGATGWSLATIIGAFSGSFIELLIARSFLGLTEAVLSPASWSVVARLFPAHRLSLAISVLSTGSQIGAAASFALGGLLIAEASRFTGLQLPLVGSIEPWQFVFLVAGVVGLVLAFLIFVAPRSDSGRDTSKGADKATILPFVRANRAFLICHFVGFASLCALVYGAASWVPTFLLRTYTLDIRTVGLILALTAVPIGVAGFMFNGWAADKSFAKGHDDAHHAHFAYISMALAIIGGFGFFFASKFWIIVACVALVSFLQPFAGVAAAVLQIATPPELRGRMSAAFLMFYIAFGMIVGPSFVAFISDGIGTDRGLAVAMSLNFAIFGSGAALFLWLGRKHAAKAVARLRHAEAA